MDIQKIRNIQNDWSREMMRVPRVDTAKVNPAKWAYERMVKYINEFEKELDGEHEIGGRIVSFGNVTTFHIQDMSYHGPDIITFYGLNENQERVQLIQHISQLNILLVALKKLEEKPRRMGFVSPEKESGEEKNLD